VDQNHLVGALRRHVLAPQEQVTGFRTSGIVGTARGDYHVTPADWLVAAKPWVTAALRVSFQTYLDCAPGVGHAGLLVEDGATVHPLNDPAALSRLGARVGRDLSPLAYAELLAEFHTSDAEPRPARLIQHPGELIRDVDAFRAAEPGAAAVPLNPPRVGRTARGRMLHFYSYCRAATDRVSAIDIAQWAVVLEDGCPANWERHLTAPRVERPPVPRQPEPRGPKRKAVRRGMR
jgi:hypothetical protein